MSKENLKAGLKIKEKRRHYKIRRLNKCEISGRNTEILKVQCMIKLYMIKYYEIAKAVS